MHASHRTDSSRCGYATCVCVCVCVSVLASPSLSLSVCQVCWQSMRAHMCMCAHKHVPRKKSIHHHRGTPPLSVCRLISRSQSRNLWRIPFLGKPRERGDIIGPERRVYSIEASEPEKGRKEGFHGGVFFPSLMCEHACVQAGQSQISGRAWLGRDSKLKLTMAHKTCKSFCTASFVGAPSPKTPPNQ